MSLRSPARWRVRLPRPFDGVMVPCFFDQDVICVQFIGGFWFHQYTLLYVFISVYNKQLYNKIKDLKNQALNRVLIGYFVFCKLCRNYNKLSLPARAWFQCVSVDIQFAVNVSEIFVRCFVGNHRSRRSSCRCNPASVV